MYIAPAACSSNPTLTFPKSHQLQVNGQLRYRRARWQVGTGAFRL